MVDYFEIPCYSGLFLPELIHEWIRECSIGNRYKRLNGRKFQYQSNIFELLVKTSEGLSYLLRLIVDPVDKGHKLVAFLKAGRGELNNVREPVERFDLTSEECSRMLIAFGVTDTSYDNTGSLNF